MSERTEQLHEAIGVKNVNSMEDLLKIQEFVFEAIPYTETPFAKKVGIEVDDRAEVDLLDVYIKCKHKDIGGWCGMNAEYFRLVLVTYGVKCWPYNYGIHDTRFSHVCVVVEFDGMQFLMDPYFNRVYSYKNDFLLRFPELVSLIQSRNTNVITSRYGTSKKPVEVQDGFIDRTGGEFEDSVFEFFYSIGMESALQNVFGEDNPHLLMLIKIPDPPK